MGHPLPSAPIHCIVTSENGLDLASCAQRAKICSLLWSSGISCEYLGTKRCNDELTSTSIEQFKALVNEWSSSVDRICGICAILKHPVCYHCSAASTQNEVSRQASSDQQHYTASGLSIHSAGEELVPLSSLSAVLMLIASASGLNLQ